ncbi:unnamed protein product, partial [Ectocarpus sp. 12 AP-2014]
MICGRSSSSSWMKLIPHVAVTTGGGHAAYSADWPCSSCAVPRSACRPSHRPQGCRRDVERVQTREDSLPPAAMERSEARGRVKRVEVDCDGVTSSPLDCFPGPLCRPSKHLSLSRTRRSYRRFSCRQAQLQTCSLVWPAGNKR